MSAASLQGQVVAVTGSSSGIGAATATAFAAEGAAVVVNSARSVEEGQAGARRMLDDGFLTLFPCEAMFGMHNMPGRPEGSFVALTTFLRTTRFTVAFDSGWTGRVIENSICISGVSIEI